jgi:hypothetical protein
MFYRWRHVNSGPVFLTLAAVFFVVGLIAVFFVRLPDKAYLITLPAQLFRTRYTPEGVHA